MSIIDAALSSINTEREKLLIASHNIANAEVENYSRLEASQEAMIINGNLLGTQIVSINGITDDFMEGELLTEISQFNHFQMKKYYYDKIDRTLGKPGAGNSIDSYTTDVFNQLQLLATQPDSIANKAITIQKLTTLTEEISSLAQTLENFRLDADNRIGTEAQALNIELKNLYALNLQLNSFPKGTIDYANLYTEFQTSLQTVSQYLEIKQLQTSDGYIQVFTNNGYTLMSSDHIHQLNYTPAGNINTLINDGPLNTLYIGALNKMGGDIGLVIPLTAGTQSSNMTTQLSVGKVPALMQMRDQEIPQMLSQLDFLAKTIKDQFNAVHNSANGFAPPPQLTGSYLATLNQTLNFTGNFRISLVNPQSGVVTTDNIPPLTLNFNTLDTGNGAGAPNLEGVINEINYHFGNRLAKDSHVEIATLTDIKLAAVSSSLTPGAPLNLDLELANYSGTDTQIAILSATALDNLNTNIPLTFNNSTFDIASGNTLRTGMGGPSVVINNPVEPINFPYTITLNMQINEGGNTYLSTISYQMNNPIPDPINGIKNFRFPPTTLTGAGVLYGPTTDYAALTASLVDINGNLIPPNSTAAGRLSLVTANSNLLIAYDNMNSVDVGNPAQNIMPSNESFGQFFGINDLFVRTDAVTNWSNTKNTALYLDLRSDIKTNASYFSSAKLRMTPQNNINGTPIYTYELTAGDTDAVNAYLNIAQTNYFFPNIGTMPSINETIVGYAGDIISFTTALGKYNFQQYDKHKHDQEALRDALDSIRGVDINAELLKMTLYQQIFQASTKVIETQRKFDDLLLNAF